MRLARNILVVIALVLGIAPALWAQHSAGLMDAACGCSACSHGGQDHGCCPPLVPCLTQGFQDMLGCLFCCPGLNARHDIYRAALNRNDFGKCSKFLPIYSCRKCCCGRVSAGACPNCGPGNAMGGEEVLETQEVPQGIEMEPTPAVEPETPPTPAEAVPPQATRTRARQGHGPAAVHRAAKPAVSAKTARNSSMRDRVVRAEVGDEVPQSMKRTAAQPTSLIQRAMLLQTRDSEPDNSLRK